MKDLAIILNDTRGALARIGAALDCPGGRTG
jgi:hypothetical protein